MFRIDDYRNEHIEYIDVKPSYEIRQRSTAGESINTGTRIQDIIGTFINFDVTIEFDTLTSADRKDLIYKLTEPVEFHTFELPVDLVGEGIVNGWYTFDGYIDGFTDNLKGTINGEYYWGSINLKIKSKKVWKRWEQG